MLPEKTNRLIYIYTVYLVAISIMLGSALSNASQFILLVGWLVGGNFKNKLLQLKSNGVFWSLAAVYFFHLIGLFYTNDMNWGILETHTKLPLLLAPLVFFTNAPLTSQELKRVFYFFIVGCAINTLWCLIYSFILHPGIDIREASRSMSHIRLGMFLDLAICCCVYLFFEIESFKSKLIAVLTCAYFILVLFLLGLASGLVYLAIIIFASICWLAFKQKLAIKISLVMLLIFALGFMWWNMVKIADQQLKPKNELVNTKLNYNNVGREYVHLELFGQKENGYYVLMNVQPHELETAWKLRVPGDAFDYASNTNMQRSDVLLRYMASKGLTKDSVGFSQLTEEDIKNIQQNICNYQFPEWSFLRKRIYELVNEYDEFINNRRTHGHSVSMRFYYWKKSIEIIKQHPLLGVGTGDVQQELNKLFEQETVLTSEWYKHPHNQFISIAVAMGVPALLVFIWSLIYPVVQLRKTLHAVYWPFLVISVMSFFTEDTLESLAGISFFAIWNALFLSQAWLKKQQNLEGLPANH